MHRVRVSVERTHPDRAKLRLSGRLQPGWCGNLAAGLADLAVAIDQGRGIQAEDGSWRADFELRIRPSDSLEPEEVAELIGTDARAGFRSRVSLCCYRIERLEARGGCLYLTVEGEDRVGFLAVLLRRLAFLSLFPIELRLETIDSRARDRLWLRGGLGCKPIPSAERALVASLDALLKSERSRIDPGGVGPDSAT